MKKLFAVALILLFVDQISAQNLLIDKIEDNGDRLLQTKYTNVYMKMWTGGAVSLSCVVSGADTNYILFFKLCEFTKQMDEGRHLLIKLKNGSIITLQNIIEIGPEDYTITVNGECLIFPAYPIPKDELLSIINDNVVKIRIETNTEMLDRNITGKMSKILKEDFLLINKALKEPKEKKSIYSDF